MLKNTILSTLSVGLIILLLLVCIKVFDISYPVTLTTSNKASEFSVVGEGKVEVVPDTAYIDVGINVSNATSVEDAQKTINTTNDKIIAAMKGLGIDKADIKTSNYSVNPNYVYEGNTNKINGYNGNVTVTIKVHKPDLASQVVDAASKAGANQIQGTRFVVAKPEQYRELARDKAIQNAKDQAAKIAGQLGIKLGRVTNIIESSNGASQVYPMFDVSAKNMAAGSGGGPNIEAGTQEVSSTVTLFFEKK